MWAGLSFALWDGAEVYKIMSSGMKESGWTNGVQLGTVHTGERSFGAWRLAEHIRAFCSSCCERTAPDSGVRLFHGISARPFSFASECHPVLFTYVQTNRAKEETPPCFLENRWSRSESTLKGCPVITGLKPIIKIWFQGQTFSRF